MKNELKVHRSLRKCPKEAVLRSHICQFLFGGFWPLNGEIIILTLIITKIRKKNRDNNFMTLGKWGKLDRMNQSNNNTCINMTQKKYIPFKVRYDLEDRTSKFNKFSTGSSEGNIALIIEPLSNSKLGHFDNCRFAIDRAKTINYFRAMLQAKLGIDDNTTSVYLFTGKKLLHEGGMQMGQIYDQYKDEDGFLYITYAENNPF